jgi:hypothetical protein
MASRSSGVMFFVLVQLARSSKAAMMIAIADLTFTPIGFQEFHFSGE